MTVLIRQPEIEQQVIDEHEVITHTSKSSFIEANTQKVKLKHLQEECIIPVFSKDNETTISHYEFITATKKTVQQLFPEFTIGEPDIRVSHMIKGRIPSAIGKPAKELLEHEKTLYYERCAFMIEVPGATDVVNGNSLNLTIGGVRAYNQENLYSKKTVEKFKVFIGFKNTVCTNLCIATDGFTNEIRVTSVEELESRIRQLVLEYNRAEQLRVMQLMASYYLTEEQFAHLIGKIRMYQHLTKDEQKQLFPFSLNDGQINSVVKDYYTCPNFSVDDSGRINLWNLYNLFTEANKSSYVDNNLERNVFVYEFTNYLCKSLQKNTSIWFLPNNIT